MLRWRGEEGSSPVEFVLVGLLLTTLTLGVIQVGVAMYVRNVSHDASVAAAFHAALADVTPAEGAAYAEQIIHTALGEDFAAEVSVIEIVRDGQSYVQVTVSTVLPMIGFLGVPGAWEVSARAPVESFGD